MTSELYTLYDTLYRTIATRIDLVTIGINLCVLVVLLLQIKKSDKKARNAFILYISSIVICLVMEMIGWETLFHKTYLWLFKLTTIVDFFLLWVIPGCLFYLILCVLEYKVQFSKCFCRVYLGLFVLFGALVFIPPIQNKIISFDENLVMYHLGDWGYIYYILESVLVLVGIIQGACKIKKIGIRDYLVGTCFMIIPGITCYIDAWWASTISMLFMSYLLIILLGITYQKRLILSREQEQNRQVELSDAKTKLLLTQIHPHFLYNTLTTLKYLCEVEPSKASKLCDHFSSYLRANIDAVDDDGLVPFEKELQNIENYLKIEQARFEDRVKYQFQIEVKEFLVPVLSLQTIVENAVKKGICPKLEGGTIWVRTKELENDYVISIEDDGIGFDVEKATQDGKNHVGIVNTKARLKTIEGSLTIESTIGKGTICTVSIPKGEY